MESHAHRERALAVALLVSLVLWNLPFGGMLLYPFKLLATWHHEMSHGVVMVLTGAGFDYLEIFRDTSGLAHADGTVAPAGQAAIASAGYVGTALWGAIMLVVAQNSRGARLVLTALGAALILSALFWISNEFGQAVTVLGGFAFLGIALFAGPTWSYYAANFVAAQACINAVLDIRVLFRAQMVVNGDVSVISDAHNMASATFGPPALWASVWLGCSLVTFYVALRIIKRKQRSADDGQRSTDDGSRSTVHGKRSTDDG